MAKKQKPWTRNQLILLGTLFVLVGGIIVRVVLREQSPATKQITATGTNDAIMADNSVVVIGQDNFVQGPNSTYNDNSQGLDAADVKKMLDDGFTNQEEAIVKRLAQELRPQLERASPRGHAVFGIKPDGFVVPKGLIPDGMEIDWDSGKVLEFSDTRVEVYIPSHKRFPNVKVVGTRYLLDKRVGAKSRGMPIGLRSPTGEIRSIRPILELIGIDGDLVVVALSFEERTR